MSPALEARAVQHVYGTGATAFTALKGIDLSVTPGEVLLLMGPSGSGKTTLLQILGCLLTPSDGEVRLKGHSLTGLGAEERGRLRLKHFGFVFQHYNLFPALTAVENVIVAFDLQGVGRMEARARAMGLLGSVGLETKAQALPAELSGGQKQRVAIARAMAGAPDIILADEPTAALDSESGTVIVDLLRRLAHDHRRTVVIVTHDARIQRVADRIIQLEDGRIAAAD
jgi:putative ABC transport system ATP-binding protein